MKILAFGATGFVGRHLVPLLAGRGHEVCVASRSGTSGFPPPVRTILADPTAPGPWQESLADFDAVVNLAGAPVATRWTTSARREILQSRIQSTRNIVDALAATSNRTLLCANAVGYYGDGADRVLTESSPQGTGFLADVAAAWQKEARQAEHFGHRVITPRISVVLGRGGALARLITPFSLGLGGRLGNGRQWFPWVHAADLSRALAFLLETPEAAGPFNICAPHSVTNAQFAAALGQALGRPAILPVPAFALRLGLGEAAEMLLTGQRCVPAALEAMGFSFEYPELGPALSDLVEQFKASPTP